ncbi:MAG: type II toxin-antitoxin system VapC family toxin [Terracidiphilus sp.]
MILLDTHVVIWLMNAPHRVSTAATEAIAENGKDGALPCVSAISIYELMYAQRRGRVQFQIPVTALLGKMRAWFRVRPVTESVAIEAATLPASFHGDPMDRIVAATAIVERCTLITADERILSSGVCRTLW